MRPTFFGVVDQTTSTLRCLDWPSLLLDQETPPTSPPPPPPPREDRAGRTVMKLNKHTVPEGQLGRISLSLFRFSFLFSSPYFSPLLYRFHNSLPLSFLIFLLSSPFLLFLLTYCSLSSLYSPQGPSTFRPPSPSLHHPPFSLFSFFPFFTIQIRQT